MKWIGIAALTGALLGAVLFADRALGSRNASGTMAGVNGPYTAGSVISSAVINARFSDIETEITDSLNRSGKGGMLAALRGTDGTVTAPAFSFTSETGTGIYRIGSSDLGVAINQSKKLELTSSLFTVVPNIALTGFLSGNLGIGAAATYPLDVFSQSGLTTARFIASGTIPLTIVQNSSVADTAVNAVHDGANWKYATSSGVVVQEGTASTSKLEFKTAPSGTAGNTATLTTRLSVDPTGVAIANDLTVTGITTAAEYLCSSFGVSGTRCGNVSANGSGDATVTIASGFHACNCSDAGVVTPAATGCNISGTTLTIKTGANHVINYLCY